MVFCREMSGVENPSAVLNGRFVAINCMRLLGSARLRDRKVNVKSDSKTQQ